MSVGAVETAAAGLRRLIEAARPLRHGETCGATLRDALLKLMDERREPGDPPPPALGPLSVRRDGLPDWWTDANLLLVDGDGAPTLAEGVGSATRVGNIAVVGACATVGRLAFPGAGGLIVVGEGVDMLTSGLTALSGGAIMVGEGCTAGAWARVDARNGGLVLVGEDGLWGAGVNLVTDDMHAILDRETGRRVNRFGGRIVVERHVWLGDEARLVGGARVGAHTVVGMRALVRDALPEGALCEGAPARPVRRGVTWTREDAA